MNNMKDNEKQRKLSDEDLTAVSGGGWREDIYSAWEKEVKGRSKYGFFNPTDADWEIYHSRVRAEQDRLDQEEIRLAEEAVRQQQELQKQQHALDIAGALLLNNQRIIEGIIHNS
jgi:septin family protein